MGLKIRHPDIVPFGEAVDEKQFRQVHAPKGWELVAPEVVLAHDVLDVTVASLDDLSLEQLQALATSVNVEVKGRASKPQLVAAIKGSAQTEVVAAAAEEE